MAYERKLTYRLWAIVALVGVSLILAGPLAFASVASDWTQKSVNQVSYKFNAKIVNEDSTTKAKGVVKTVSGDGVAAGSMGIQAQLYTAAKKLVVVSSYSYNKKGESKVTASTSAVKTSDTTYYARSNVKLYNGSGYNTYQSEKSPIHKAPSKGAGTSASTVLKTTVFQGKSVTYGSGMRLDADGNQPDLISAIGVNGEEGYVLASDLDSDTECAVSIPVYSLDGEVVDSFTIGGE